MTREWLPPGTITADWPRRKPGVCWSCATRRPVRPRIWLAINQEHPTCADCERQAAGRLATMMPDSPPIVIEWCSVCVDYVNVLYPPHQAHRE